MRGHNHGFKKSKYLTLSLSHVCVSPFASKKINYWLRIYDYGYQEIKYPFLICTHGSQTLGKRSNKGPKPSGSLRGLKHQNHRQLVDFRFKRTLGTTGSLVPAVSRDQNRRLLTQSKNCQTLVWSGVRIPLGTQKIGVGVLGALLRVGRWGVGSAHSGRRWRGRRDSRICGYGIRRGTERVAPFLSFPFFSFSFLAPNLLMPTILPLFSPFLWGGFFPLWFWF